MANPTKLEAFYDRFETWWCDLPIVRDQGRLQAFPFILFFLVMFVTMGIVWKSLVLWIAADWPVGLRTAFFGVGLVMGTFVTLIVLMVRSAQRTVAGEQGDRS